MKGIMRMGNVKRFGSLVEAIQSCKGCVTLHGYAALRVNAEDQNRAVKSYYKPETGERKMVSHFTKVGVSKDYDGVYIKFPFDSNTGNLTEDEYHHTTCTVGSIIAGSLTGDYEIDAVLRNEKGQFEVFQLEWDRLCPQIPDSSLENYKKDRAKWELIHDELRKAEAQAKKRGLIEKEDRSGWGMGTPKDKVENVRRQWELADLPKNGQFSWAKMTDKDLMERIETLCNQEKAIHDLWAASMGLEWVEDTSQLMRILDGGMVESGRWEIVVTRKMDCEYLDRNDFLAKVKRNEVMFNQELPDGRYVGTSTKKQLIAVSENVKVAETVNAKAVANKTVEVSAGVTKLVKALKGNPNIVEQEEDGFDYPWDGFYDDPFYDRPGSDKD